MEIFRRGGFLERLYMYARTTRLLISAIEKTERKEKRKKKKRRAIAYVRYLLIKKEGKKVIEYSGSRRYFVCRMCYGNSELARQTTKREWSKTSDALLEYYIKVVGLRVYTDTLSTRNPRVEFYDDTHWFIRLWHFFFFLFSLFILLFVSFKHDILL